MTPGESHYEWYHYYCSNFYVFKLPFVIKIFVLSIFEWPFYTGFTVTIITALIMCDYLSLFKHCLAFLELLSLIVLIEQALALFLTSWNLIAYNSSPVKPPYLHMYFATNEGSKCLT